MTACQPCLATGDFVITQFNGISVQNKAKKTRPDKQCKFCNYLFGDFFSPSKIISCFSEESWCIKNVSTPVEKSLGWLVNKQQKNCRMWRRGGWNLCELSVWSETDLGYRQQWSTCYHLHSTKICNNDRCVAIVALQWSVTMIGASRVLITVITQPDAGRQILQSAQMWLLHSAHWSQSMKHTYCSKLSSNHVSNTESQTSMGTLGLTLVGSNSGWVENYREWTGHQSADPQTLQIEI